VYYNVIFWGAFAWLFLPWNIITYPECVSIALVIQHAKRMSRVVLSSVACLVVPYFSTLSHKQHDLKKKKFWTWNACLDFLYNFCLKQIWGASCPLCVEYIVVLDDIHIHPLVWFCLKRFSLYKNSTRYDHKWA